MFSVNWSNLIINFLPPNKRGVRFVDLIRAAFKPLIDIYTPFISYRADTLETLSFTGQVIYMEYLLNKKFTGGLTTIYISDAVLIEETYLYRKSESETPVYIYRTSEAPPIEHYIYRSSEYESDYDFIVFVPNTLVFDENEMKATIELYKLAGKRYKIETYIP